MFQLSLKQVFALVRELPKRFEDGTTLTSGVYNWVFFTTFENLVDIQRRISAAELKRHERKKSTLSGFKQRAAIFLYESAPLWLRSFPFWKAIYVLPFLVALFVLLNRSEFILVLAFPFFLILIFFVVLILFHVAKIAVLKIVHFLWNWKKSLRIFSNVLFSIFLFYY